MSSEFRNVLQVDNLTVRYHLPRRSLFGGAQFFTAVKEATLSVAPGASLALVGESGSGKSSLAKAVMGLEPVSSGSVRLFGNDLDRLSSAELRRLRRRFQMIFQDPYGSLDPRHSVARIIAEPLLDASAAEKRERAAQALHDVGLGPGDLGKYPHQFSGGQRQRIAIARALVTRPELIVADEPVSALDVSIQAQVLNLMQDLQAEYGMAYLFISHDLAVVEYLCEDVLVMFRGTIVESGKTRDVMTAPAHPYTRELVEAMPRLGARKRVSAGAATSESGPQGGIGCAYRTRCPLAQPVCDTAPELRPSRGGRRVACHLA